MAFVKVIKNKAYFMRYQTKFKRRREGKTDYYARKRLVIQDKNKYNSPKYRLVARITNGRVIAQVIFATLQGDKVFCQAESTELKKWGVNAGLTNYAAAYATGLLLARRLLNKVGLDTMYEGNSKVGENYDAGEDVRDRRPFKLILDVGLKATTTGSKIFAVMKGAADGGAYVPHSDKRFPGSSEDGENKVLRNRIFGAHVDVYMKHLKGTERENVQFRRWNDALTKSGSKTVEALYQKVHAEIRKNPVFTKKAANSKPKREHTKFHRKRLTNAQRKANVNLKIEIRMKEIKKLEKKSKK
jgi:large subunit ribosomal protein L5e